MKKIFLLLLISLSLVSVVPQERHRAYIYTEEALHPKNIDLMVYVQNLPDYYGFVTRVADGDTFYVQWFSEEQMGIRVKGIDTPETVHRTRGVEHWGPEASEYAYRVLKPGTLVRLKFEGAITDPFGRLLAYVWYWDGYEWVNFQEEMLRTGNAFVYHDYRFEYPNEYMDFQQYAIDNRLGMWANPELIVNDVVTTREEFARRRLWYRREYYQGD